MELMEKVTRIEKILKSIQQEIVKIYTKLLDNANGELSGIEEQAKCIEDYLHQVKDNIESGQFTIDHQDQVLGLTSNILDFDDFMDFEDTSTNYNEQTIIDEVKPDIRSNSTYKLMQECLNKRAFVVLEKLELPTNILQIPNANLKTRKSKGRYKKIGQRKKRLSKSKLTKYEKHLKKSLQLHQDQDKKPINESNNTVFESEDMQYEKVDNLYHCKSISCIPLYRKFPSFAKFEKHYERVHTRLQTPLNCGLDGCLTSLYSHREMFLHKDECHSSCSKCKAKLGTRRKLLRHLRDSHKRDQFKCKLCSRVYNDSNYLRQHFMRVHIEKKNYSNKRISKYNDGKRTIPKSESKNQKIDPEDNFESSVFELYKGLCKKSLFKCDIDNCDKVVVSKKSLEFHKYTHQIPDFDLHWNKLCCAVCTDTDGNIFSTRESLRKHLMKEHFPSSLKYQFKCSFCDKAYTTNYGLKIHKESSHSIPYVFENRPLTLTSKSHSRPPAVAVLISKSKDNNPITLTSKSPKIYKCMMCDKMFSFRNNLKRHEKTHSRSKSVIQSEESEVIPKTRTSVWLIRDPQTCTVCDKTFKNKYRLKAHEKIHTRSTTSTHHCPKLNCTKTFNFEHGLKLHLRLRHGDIKCPVQNCVYRFISQTSCDTHMENFHGEKVVCPICSKMLSRAQLKHHNSDFHREFKCTFEGCPQVFRRELQLRKHQAGHDPNLKPEFLCTVCGVGKWTKRCLAHHVRLYHAAKMSCPYEGCSKCAFTQQDKLTEHINMAHKHDEKRLKKKKK